MYSEALRAGAGATSRVRKSRRSAATWCATPGLGGRSLQTSGSLARSRALYYTEGRGGLAGNWVDGTAHRGIRQTWKDENHHLAKVRVENRIPSSAPSQ